MNWHNFKRSSAFSSGQLFALASLVGWCVFNLQMISIVKLLDEHGIEFLPALMLIQAFLSWLLLRLWGNAALKSVDAFFLSALAVGFGVSLGAAFFPWSNSFYVGGLFILSQLSVSALRMGIHVTFSKRISILRNPSLTTQLSIAEESGFLFGAVTLAVIPAAMRKVFFDISVVPFVLAALVLIPILKAGFSRTREATPTPVPKRPPSFFNWILALFGVVASLKSIQWFGMAYGFSEAAKQGISLIDVFSKSALIQSVLTLVILLASLKFSSKIPTWTLGFRLILLGHAASALILMGFPNPALLVGAEVMRKVLERGFFARSLQLLTATIPDENRLEIRHLMERWSTTCGIVVSGLLAWLLIHHVIPVQILWFAAFGLAVVGLVLRTRLFEVLSDFHVANLSRAQLDGVIQGCQVLANPECKKHHAALTGLLQRHPRPIITKNILHALGRMQEPSVVPYTVPFLDSDREDIQLAAVKALLGYGGHEVNLILLKRLREMVQAKVFIRINVVRCITQKLERLVIPYLIELLESAPVEDRVVANAVEILGELAHEENDQDLMDYLAKFLNHKGSRRIRVNAVVALYRHRKHGKPALEAFDRLLISSENKDRDAAAFIAGKLSLRAHEEFIWERSLETAHGNITLLMALLRLDNPEAPALISHWVVSDNEERANDALVKLSVAAPRYRTEVFFELIEHSPELLDLALQRMRKSQREFDADRELIREEAFRRGIKLEDEEAWIDDKTRADGTTPAKKIAA